MVAAER